MTGSNWIGRDTRPARDRGWYDVLKRMNDGSVLVHFSPETWPQVEMFLRQETGRNGTFGRQPQAPRGMASKYDTEDRPTPNEPEWHATQVLNFFSLHPGLSTLPPHVVNPILDHVSEGHARAGTVIGAIKEFDRAFLMTIPQIGDKSTDAILTAYKKRGAVPFVKGMRWQPRAGNGRGQREGDE